MSGQGGGRYQRSATGMIGALIVLVAVIVGYVLFRGVIRTEPENPVQAVNYQQPLSYAREQADFRVLAPASLPTGWKATNVEFAPDPGRWHLGVLTDQGRYVGLEQADDPERTMVTTYVDRAASRGKNLTIDGQSWSTWSDSGGDTALVRRQGEVTTLVVGSVAQAVLVDYVRSLR